MTDAASTPTLPDLPVSSGVGKDAIDLSTPVGQVLWAQRNPVAWLRMAFGSRLWSGQRRILESVVKNKATIVRSCHGAGKSFTAAQVVIWFLACHPRSIVFTTAPTAAQVRAILWQEIRAAWSRQIVPIAPPDVKPNLTSLTFGEKWFAFGRTADDANGFQGLHADYILGVVDEASGVSKDIQTAVAANLSTGHARLLEIGNPTDPTSEFATLARDPLIVESGGSIKISAFDTPNFVKFGITLADMQSGAWRDKVGGAKLPFPYLVTPEYVDEVLRRDGVNSPIFRARVLAEFPTSSDDALLTLAQVEACQARWLDLEDKNARPITIGVDVARYGSDKTAYCLRRGNRAEIINSVQGQSTIQTAAKARVYAETHSANAVRVDEIGVGGGVVDTLEEAPPSGSAVEGVNVSEKADNEERFLNRRAELAWNIRERCEQGRLAIPPNAHRLVKHMLAQRWKVTPGGKIQLVSKDEVKAEIGESPDEFDALCLAFADGGGQDFLDAMRNA